MHTTPSINLDGIDDLIGKHHGSDGSIIAILEDIQASYNYLPRAALELVSAKTGRSLVDLYGIATFYTYFSLEPRGDHLASVCTGTACHVRGAPAILDEFQANLGVAPGETTEDRCFTLTTVNCLGACALGPVAVIDGEYCRNIKKSHVEPLVTSYRDGRGGLTEADPEEALYLHALCPRCNRSLMTTEQTLDGQPMIQVTVSFHSLHGWLRLSSLFGDHRIESEHAIPDDSLVDFFCPRCHAELRSPRLCPGCDAPTVRFLIKGGGIINLCSRRGCKEHALELS